MLQYMFIIFTAMDQNQTEVAPEVGFQDHRPSDETQYEDGPGADNPADFPQSPQSNCSWCKYFDKYLH